MGLLVALFLGLCLVDTGFGAVGRTHQHPLEIPGRVAPDGVGKFPLKPDAIRIRDPFIVPDANEGLYYMFAETGNRLDKTPGYDGDDETPKGVEVYTSPDLQNWAMPQKVLHLDPEHFSGPSGLVVKTVWAPEVHRYGDNFYLFVTLTFDGEVDWMGKEYTVRPEWWPRFRRRGTHVFRSTRGLLGPFEPFGPSPEQPLTPPSWMALDGTLYVEPSTHTPYLVFCHEWVQIGNGTMEVVPLSADLSHTVGNPTTLFDARAGPWATDSVTDGPFMHRTESGDLLMIWSNGGPSGYAVGIARSESGNVHGPWVQQAEPLFSDNGGHGMMFKNLNGQLMLSVHSPNILGAERLRLVPLQGDFKNVVPQA